MLDSSLQKVECMTGIWMWIFVWMHDQSELLELMQHVGFGVRLQTENCTVTLVGRERLATENPTNFPLGQTLFR